ncbi:MAG: nuclear transport factor 2 family protein [Hyphomicrobiales bacterium]
MNDDEANAVMARFASAYFSKREERIREAVTPDVEWHFAFGPDGADGRVRKGVEGILRGIAENDALFARLRFDDVVIRAFGEDQVVMTYTANGQARATGEEFSLRGIELITVRDGRVHRKDVFWKHRTGP